MEPLLTAVQLRDFRSYTRAEARLGGSLSVVHGPNGAGKSNLLEAIYYGCTGRSPRTRNERELVRFGAEATRVTVQLLEGEEAHELAVGFGAAAVGGQPSKRMSADGATVERVLELPFRPLVSVFLPDRLELVKGPPALRRSHMDQLVAALWPARVADRSEYSRALAQRNALLGGIRAGRASRASLGAWDQELARAGLQVRERRARAVELLQGVFADRAGRLGVAGEVSLRYRPRVTVADADEYVRELADRLDRDLERGFSGYGPHRDELLVLRDGRELRVYGSQGEQRLALLALLLAERAVLAEERGQVPLMLLDDVMSELDAQRRETLAAELRASGQSVIATTDLGFVPGAGDPSVARLRISPGTVMQEAIAA